MGSVMLSKIEVTSIARIATNGGDVLHALKHTDAQYSGFGEAYFSWVESQRIKAWKRHTKMTMNFIVPLGHVRFVFCDIQPDGNIFRTEEIGDDNYSRVTVPPGIWFGFQGLMSGSSLILNIANIPHDPSEVTRLNESDINYNWS